MRLPPSSIVFGEPDVDIRRRPLKGFAVYPGDARTADSSARRNCSSGGSGLTALLYAEVISFGTSGWSVA